MRPHENGYGLTLENADEMKTFADGCVFTAGNFRANAESLGDRTEEGQKLLCYAYLIDQAGLIVQGKLDIQNITGEPLTDLRQGFPDEYSHELIGAVLNHTSELHPDEELRKKAAAMIISMIRNSSGDVDGGETLS